MLLVYIQCIIQIKELLDRMVYCIETTVTMGIHNIFPTVNNDRYLSTDTVLLFEVALRYIELLLNIQIGLLEYISHILRRKLRMTMIGNTLHQISNLFLHLIRQDQTEAVL